MVILYFRYEVFSLPCSARFVEENYIFIPVFDP